MLVVHIKRPGLTALFAVALAVSASAASPDTAPPAGSQTPAQNSASLFPQLPEEGAEFKVPDGGFGSGRRSSAGGTLGGASSAAEIPSARALDQLDRRRNWIYATQSQSSFELSAEQAAGVRSSQPAGGAGESEGWLSEFFQDRGAQRTENRSIDDVLSNSLNMSSSVESPLLGGMAPQGISALNLGMAPWESVPREASTGSNSRSEASDSLGLRNQGLSSVPNSVRDLLGYPGTMNSLAPNFDPINLRTDTTQQELNPTAAERLVDLETTPRTVDALLNRPGDATYGRSSLLEGLNAPMLGGSSLSPAVLPPAEARAADRSLNFGQFPSRKF